MQVVLAYKNFAANRNISHIGLGVAAMNTQKVLHAAGVQTEVWPILSAAHLSQLLDGNAPKHVLISAPWIPTKDLSILAQKYPGTHFTVVCHSNVGFLQADQNGVRLMREVIDLEMGSHNVHLGGNCRRFTSWVEAAFGVPCAFLPNLYYLDGKAEIKTRKQFQGGTLRIGVFGATRPLKNFMSAAAAALSIARSLHVPLELWFSSGRAEGGGETVWGAIQQLLSGFPDVTLKQSGWQSWPQFRALVGSMHLLLQPSYTESFNMVTADGIAEGIPSVVSEAIDWVPEHWRAEVDDVNDIARVGKQLLTDSSTEALAGLRALQAYVREGLAAYREFTL